LNFPQDDIDVTVQQPQPQQQQQEQQQQTDRTNTRHSQSGNNTTIVNGQRQQSVRFEDVRVYGVDDPLPGHSRWTDEELAHRHGAEMPMDVDVPNNNDNGENFQVR